MLEHGGQLLAAAAQYGIPAGEWLDLSTGINPQGYVPPSIPRECWSRLPQEQDGLEQAAAAYYGTADLVPVAGSQVAIQLLPRLRTRSRVGVLHPGYAEHAHAWRRAGHEVVDVNANGIEAQMQSISVLVLMNPNNPTGEVFTPEQLLCWHACLAARGGWLVVDEAYGEAAQTASLLRERMPEGMIVLRSLGKFFGLAGARVGFVAADAALLGQLRVHLGPWHLPGPSRHVAQAALSDGAWQAATRARLKRDGTRLAQLLSDAGMRPSGGCGLFQWVRTERAAELHRELAQRGILTRLFEQPRSMRFGLPGSEAGWEKLSAALRQECAA